MNSRRLTRTPYRLISRARELRPVTSRQMVADFEMLCLAYLEPGGGPLCGPWSTIEPRSAVKRSCGSVGEPLLR
jgi:hypothetical protein